MASQEVNGRDRRARHAREQKQDAERITSQVGEHLEGEGYHTGQHLVGGSAKPIYLRGEKQGDLVLAAIWLGVAVLREDSAISIREELKSELGSVGGSRAILVLVEPVHVEDGARMALAAGAIKLATLDPDSGALTVLPPPQ